MSKPLTQSDCLTLLSSYLKKEQERAQSNAFAAGGPILPRRPVPVVASTTATVRPANPFVIQSDRLASIRAQVAANAPVLKPTGYVPEVVKDKFRREQAYKEAENKILNASDLASMTLPIPVVGETVGLLGAGIGAGIRASRAADDARNGNYLSAAANAGLAALGITGALNAKGLGNTANSLLDKVAGKSAVASADDPLIHLEHLKLAPRQLKREYTELAQQGISGPEINRILTTRYPDKSTRYSFDPAQAPLQQSAQPVNSLNLSLLKPEQTERLDLYSKGIDAGVDFHKRNPTDLSRFTKKDMAQFDFYSKGSDAGLNLRSPGAAQNESLIRHINEGRQLLNEGIQKHKLVTDEMLHRGVKDYVIPAGEWKDAAGVVQNVPVKFSELPVGGQHFNRGFTSTSTDAQSVTDHLGRKGGIQFEIQAPAGKQSFVQMNALPHHMYNFAEENEVLLPHSLWFKKEAPTRFSIANPYSMALPVTAGVFGAGALAGIKKRPGE